MSEDETAPESSFWSSFRDLDAYGDSGEAVAWLGVNAAIAPLRAGKQRSYELVGAQPGQRVLDVGCGSGEDVRALSALVAPDGQVIGVDSSSNAVMAAREAAAARCLSGVTFEVADAARLPFGTDEFDSCRCDRTLQHLADPHAALQEMARVVRPGGAVLVSETQNYPVAAPDVDLRGLNRLLAIFQTAAERGGPWIGLMLPALLRSVGLQDICTEVVEGAVTDAVAIETLYDLRRLGTRAVEEHRVPREELDATLELVHREAAEGRLRVAVETYLVVGRVSAERAS